jgi:hypothetical protein
MPAPYGRLDMPPLSVQARNAAAAAGRVASAAWSGRPVLADEATVRQRLTVCQSCEHRLGNRCRLCGCRLAGLLAKATFATEHCPAGKW